MYAYAHATLDEKLLNYLDFHLEIDVLLLFEVFMDLKVFQIF